MNIFISSLSFVLVFVAFNPASAAFRSDASSLFCHATSYNPPAAEIVSIQLKSPENSIEVTMNNPTVNEDKHQSIKKASGTMDRKNPSNSYLEVEFKDLSSSHNGKYDCIVKYLDKEGKEHSDVLKDELIL